MKERGTKPRILNLGQGRRIINDTLWTDADTFFKGDPREDAPRDSINEAIRRADEELFERNDRE